MGSAPVLLGLARKYYLELVAKIRQDMLEAEDQFRSVFRILGLTLWIPTIGLRRVDADRVNIGNRIKLGEIEEIKSGARDHEFIPSLTPTFDISTLSTEGGLPPLPSTMISNSKSRGGARRKWKEESESDEEEGRMEVDDVYVD